MVSSRKLYSVAEMVSTVDKDAPGSKRWVKWWSITQIAYDDVKHLPLKDGVSHSFTRVNNGVEIGQMTGLELMRRFGIAVEGGDDSDHNDEDDDDDDRMDISVEQPNGSHFRHRRVISNSERDADTLLLGEDEAEVASGQIMVAGARMKNLFSGKGDNVTVTPLTEKRREPGRSTRKRQRDSTPPVSPPYLGRNDG
ncbi:uncharacterized protein BDZ99DRAFT_472326 [Mytilinidion resinicola]|uniref:Uncharacterized protein n=1 Tax=Mytilinidion resinicola TaxID=574789 RepID=A0A6A6Z3Y5_9PEZI|nr:uncharacterized protein BDZ99DRAFT_472326 [Mytilinidion resinicola]KAF2814967.1 hypothetical protein BDZ99DRAFT_472326 [Mytilinidion resinicola]